MVTNDIFTEFFIFLFQLTPKLKKTKEEIMKHKKDSTMSTEIANQDIETTAKKVKSSEEAMKVVIEMEKLAVINTAFLGLPTNKFKYLKDLNFFDVVNMINENIMALKIY